MPQLVVADSAGRILDHPSLGMAGRSGPHVVEVPADDLLRLPEGTKLFTMPGS
ncbi:MAG: radical SAM protein, partial [candidate division NC10 bacterium]|nr:radical SAM protein [candidate division NC10 bacterium]